MQQLISRRTTPGSNRCLALCVTLLAGALAVVGPVHPRAHAGRGNSAPDFSPEERGSLDAGELIRRPMTRKRQGLELIGGTSYQVIEAPPHVVWEALLDTPHYHRMMPQILEARLVEHHGERRTVFLRQGMEDFAEKSYYLNVVIDPQQRDIAFRMDRNRPHDLRAAWGFYHVRPYGDRTLLVYGIMADIGGGLFSAMTRGAVHDWMLRTPWMVKRFVEGSGRYIYKWDERPAVAGPDKT